MLTSPEPPNLSWDIVFSTAGAGICLLFLMYVALTGEMPALN